MILSSFEQAMVGDITAVDIPGSPISAPAPTDFAAMIGELETATDRIKSIAAERDALKQANADLAGKFRAALDSLKAALA